MATTTTALAQAHAALPCCINSPVRRLRCGTDGLAQCAVVLDRATGRALPDDKSAVRASLY